MLELNGGHDLQRRITESYTLGSPFQDNRTECFCMMHGQQLTRRVQCWDAMCVPGKKINAGQQTPAVMHAIQKDHLHDTWEMKPDMIGPRTGATVVPYDHRCQSEYSKIGGPDTAVGDACCLLLSARL